MNAQSKWSVLLDGVVHELPTVWAKLRPHSIQSQVHMNLTHYIIVRRDLPLGVVAAMVAHAAGESSYLVHPESFNGARAVVLEVKSELALYKVDQLLRDSFIAHVEIVEHTDPYMNQFMAIGVVPTTDDRVREALSELQTLKSCLDKPSERGVSSQPSNDTTTNIKGSTKVSHMVGQSLLGRYRHILTHLRSFGTGRLGSSVEKD